MLEKINIMGVEYTVEEVETVNKYDPRKGECDYLKCAIRIDSEMPKSAKEQTLMHEILHAVLDLLGYDDINSDEEKVRSLATALHQVFTCQTIFS